MSVDCGLCKDAAGCRVKKETDGFGTVKHCAAFESIAPVDSSESELVKYCKGCNFFNDDEYTPGKCLKKLESVAYLRAACSDFIKNEKVFVEREQL